MRHVAVVPLLAAVLVAATAVHADELPKAECDKIEHLIQHIAELKDAVFVRNGTEYSAATAAKFLRGKWDANAKDIKSARDFIEKAASVSTTSGKPYLIRFKDGKEVPSGKYLAEELTRFEKT